MKKLTTTAVLFSILIIANTAYSQIASTTEGFDDVNNLTGWVMSNQSVPLGDNNWFQGSGDSTIMIAQRGDLLDSFIAANHRNTGGSQDNPGTICNYLIMPALGALESVSFYSRSRVAKNNFNIYPDRLYVLYSPSGEINTGDCGDNFGDFTETLLVINPNLTKISSSDALVGYPLTNWTQYNTEVSGNGRVAFVYYVENAGVFGENSNYIGIDSVEWVLAPNTPEDDTPQTPKSCLLLEESICNEIKSVKKTGT